LLGQAGEGVRITMSGIDTMKSGEFSIMEQEHDSLREKGSQQDDVRDMARLGKKQQFDVGLVAGNIGAVTVKCLQFCSAISSFCPYQRSVWLRWVDGSSYRSKPNTPPRG